MVKTEVNGLWSYKPFPFQQSCRTAPRLEECGALAPRSLEDT